MDFWKLILDKFAFYLTGIVPGAVAVSVYYLVNPSPIHRFLMPNQLGYGTKMTVALVFCFVVGNTLTTFLSSLAGAIGGAVYGVLNSNTPQWPDSPDVAPWRDPQWRKLAKIYLGQHAPSDSVPISEAEFKTRMTSLDFLPDQERIQARFELAQLRMNLATADSEWSQWYRQIDRLQREAKKVDLTDQFAEGLIANLQATAVYLLISVFFVPVLRNWMVISFCVGWCLKLVAEVYVSFRHSLDPWNSRSDQVAFLSRVTLGQLQIQESTADESKH